MASFEREPLLSPTSYNQQPFAAEPTSETDREAQWQEDHSNINSSARRTGLEDVDEDVLPETAVTGRKLGWISAYMLVLSRVIGSGIFAMPGTILQSVGSPALALLLWVVGALIAWCALSIDVEFGCMLPRSGGHKVYLEYTYRRPRFLASTIIAVHAVLLGFTASNCIVFAKYMLFALDIEATDFNVKLYAVVLMTAITIVHGVAYQTGVWVQNVLGLLKIGLIGFMILTGLYVVLFRTVEAPDELDLDGGKVRRFADLWEGSNWSYNTVSTALFKIYYSYAGLDNLNNVSGNISRVF